MATQKDPNRLQLNIRLDKRKHEELLKAAKSKAMESEISLNDFVIKALQLALGMDFSSNSLNISSNSLADIKAQLENSLETQLALLNNQLEIRLKKQLEERLAIIDNRLGEFSA